MNKIIEDVELGCITLRKLLRARNYTIRFRNGNIFVTLPHYGSYKRALEFVYEHKESLIKKIEESKNKILPKAEEVGLRQKAGMLLPEMIRQLALKHGFQYTSIKITKSRTRWGSCSSKASINLSFYLVLLPEHLIEYVLLHELCHTVHMNHGVDFWKLLNHVTDNQASILRKELKKHRIPY